MHQKRLIFALPVIFILALTCQAQLPNYVPASGLVSWYSFSGGLATDVSGNGHDGIINGAIPATDRFGNDSSAFSFNGINNFIELQNTSAFSGTTGFTLAGWVNFTSNPGDATIVTKHENFYANGFSLAAPGNQAVFVLNNGSADVIYSGNLYNDTAWHFFMGVYDGSSMYLYVDTVLLGSRDFVSPPVTNSINMRIGMESALSPFNGLIDDVGIWASVLTPSEMSSLFNAGTDGIYDVPGRHEVKIYPHPARGKINIRSMDKIENVMITDILGNEILQARPSSGNFSFELEEAGTYFATFFFKQHKLVKKITVIHP